MLERMDLVLPDGRRAQWRCNLCGEEFDRYRDMERHTVDCARVHLDELRAVGRARARDLFAPWNPDAEAHLARVGERMLREGRLTMRPNERIRNE
jgi:hypothetical protein